jgi:hypothetical protein
MPAMHAPRSKMESQPDVFLTPSDFSFSTPPTDRKLLIPYKKKLILTDIQKEVAVGVLLGDASLQTQSKTKTTYRLKFCYGQKHLIYVFHLHDVFGSWCSSPPGLAKNRNTVSFQTISHEKLKILADLFLLHDGKKGISLDLIEKHLTSRGLAYWFMDDGGKLDYTSNAGKGIVFHTQCFKKSEVELLAHGLERKFDLQTWVKPNKNGYVVAVSGKSYEIFLEHVNPFLHDSMRYKLPLPRKSRVTIFIENNPPLGNI